MALPRASRARLMGAVLAVWWCGCTTGTLRPGGPLCDRAPMPEGGVPIHGLMITKVNGARPLALGERTSHEHARRLTTERIRLARAAAQDDGPIFNEWLITHMPFLDALAVLEGSEKDHTTVCSLPLSPQPRGTSQVCAVGPPGQGTALISCLSRLPPSSGCVSPPHDAHCSA